MNRYHFTLLGAIAAGAAIAAETPIETVNVYGQDTSDAYRITGDNTATRLGLSALDTPQSLSAITESQMRDFAIVSLNDALATSAGVQVQSVETDRTYYTARGFDITNFQVDGVGMPLSYGNRAGEIDTAMYRRIEVVRGANGLMAGPGNPSATVNMIRKRPVDDTFQTVTVTAGSWSKRRLEGDIGTALNEDTRIRVVAMKEDRESYLDRYALEKKLGYVVVERDVGDKATLTVGGSFQSSDADSPLWGALPLFYSDGSQTDYDVSTSTSADWAFWNTDRRSAFVEYEQALGENWQLVATYTANGRDGDSELFYMFGQPDPDTEVGLTGYASAYKLEETQRVADIYVTGQYRVAGREHELVFGYNRATNKLEDSSLFDFTTGNGFPAIGDFRQWNGDAAYPTLKDGLTGSDWKDKQTAYYLATRYRFTDDLSLTAGARSIDWKSEGESYGESQDTEANGKVLPYAGVVYRFAGSYAAYASYTTTFMPQRDIDANLQRLDPNEGRNSELGVKGEFFDGGMLAALAVFKASHKNVSEYAFFDTTNGVSIYQGNDYDSEGVEVDVSGRLAEGLQGSINFTVLSIEDEDGEGARRYVPKRLFNASLSYAPRALAALRVGAAASWQDDIYREVTTSGGLETRVEQDSYAVLDLFAQYAFTDNLTAAVNVGNVLDKKYINSLYWEQGYYAAPRNGQLSVTWRY